MINGFYYTLFSNFFSKLVRAFSLFIIPVCLTRLDMIEELGVYALAQAIILPLLYLITLDLKNIQTVQSDSEYSFYKYLKLRLILGGISLVIIGIVLLITIGMDWFALCMQILSIRIVERIRELYFGFCIRNDLQNRIAYSNSISGINYLILIVIFYVGIISFEILLLTIFISELLILSLYDHAVVEINRKNGTFKMSDLVSFFKTSISTYCNDLNNSVAFYAITIVSTKINVGLFASIYTLAVPINMFALCFRQVLFKRLFMHYTGKVHIKKINHKIVLLIFISLLLPVIFELYGSYYIRYIYNDAMAKYNNLLVLISIGLIARIYTGFMIDYLLINKEFNKMMTCSILGCILCIGINLFVGGNNILLNIAYLYVISSITTFLIYIINISLNR